MTMPRRSQRKYQPNHLWSFAFDQLAIDNYASGSGGEHAGFPNRCDDGGLEREVSLIGGSDERHRGHQVGQVFPDFATKAVGSRDAARCDARAASSMS